MSKKGNTRIGKPAVGTQLNMNFPTSQVSFDIKAFDNIIRSQGVKVKHYRAILDPRGLNSQGEIRRDIPVGNSDGNLFKIAGCFTATFQVNDNAPMYEVQGQIDASQAMMTPPTTYDNSDEPVLIKIGDRFEYQDIELRVVTDQYVEASSIGREKLAFKATCVEELIGSDGYEYKENVHFKINAEGEIEWISQTRPGINTDLNRGEVYSIRYRYIPYFVVRRLIHEVRVVQVTDPDTGVRRNERLPYQVQVARENVFRDTKVTSNAPVQDPRFEDITDSGTIVRGSRGT